MRSTTRRRWHGARVPHERRVSGGRGNSVYVELAPLAAHRALLDHLFILVDDGTLTAPGRHRFATPFSEIRYLRRPDDDPPWQASWSRPVAAARPRQRALAGMVVGFRAHAQPSPGALPELGPIGIEGSLDAVVHALDALAADLCPRLGGAPAMAAVSQRTLRRRFDASVGLGPKAWQALHRFRGALLDLARSPASLADTAQARGYADQSHMSADFQRRAGTSPGRFAARSRAEAGGDVGRFFQDPALRQRVHTLVST
ncbi:MAG: AraC family transcriptional regulator [Variovorax sp.]|jgi:AraC-like DNA-binding protein|nr:MAG: AraC family transcriptional regulator [Variovorax sp.]